MSILFQDLRYAIRQFLKSPGFAIGAVVSLMLGIGATTTLFSVVYGVLLDPYPYKNADRIVYFELLNKEGRYQPILVNGGQFEAIRNASAVEDVLFQQPEFKNLTVENSSVSVNTGLYSPNLFVFLGVPPLLGRVLTPADAPGGNPAPVAVLSYGFWQEHYHGSREVIGKTLDLDHAPYTVIGVMPPRFAWFGSDVYLLGKPTADAHDYWMAFPKLKPGTRYAAAEAELQALVGGFAKQDRDLYGQSPRVRIVAMTSDVWGTRGTVVSLFAAAVLLLVIGCANASILLLARGAARQHEFAVRTSLGAGRGRLVRQLLTESVLLSLSGAAFGVLAAWWGVNTLRRILPDDLLPHEVIVRLNVPVLLFSAGVAMIIGIIFGLSPALEISRPHPGTLLQSGSTKVAGSTRTRRMHRLPIAGQVALTLLLLAGAGGAGKAFLAKLHAPQGFDPGRVFFIRLLGLPIPAGTTRPERAQKVFNEEEMIRQSVAQTPGVAEAGWSQLWNPGTGGFFKNIEIQSKPALTDAQAVFTPISPQLLSVLHVPLLRGRIFSSAEVQRLAHVAMVNQAFVKQYLGDVDPIGQSVRIPFLKTWDSPPMSSEPLNAWVEVIGVVGDASNNDLDHPEVRPAVFLPNTFGPPLLGGTLYVRASGDPETAIRSVKARLLQLNPSLVVNDAHTLQWELDNWGWGRERLIAAIFALYAVIALLLAATGLYSVVSFAVTQRTQELGIRMALGAGHGSIVHLVLSSTAAMLGIGIAAGLIISAILGPLVSAWGGGSLSQPLTLLGAALILVLVAAIACVLPAWRAASIDPMQVLRAE
ncbi:MAG TPA: ADOP family duplicated permease [Candidatus Solibacter sp.]|nr:ADOP family duplicated permease [Candidatus Solibacter sp.]